MFLTCFAFTAYFKELGGGIKRGLVTINVPILELL